MRILLNSLILTEKHTGYSTVISNYVYELSKYLSDNDINLEIFILIQKRAYLEFFSNVKLHDKIKFIIVKNLNLPTRLVYDQMIINYYLKKYNCDILHSPATLGTVFSIKPQILFFHASTTFMLPRSMHGRSFLATWLSNLIIKYSALNSKKILTTTIVTGRELERFLKRKINFIPIYNGLPYVKKDFKLENIKDIIKNLKNKKFVFYLSSFYKLKNHEVMIKAAKENKDIIFVLAGSSIQEDYFKYCVDLSKNLDNVIILESINEDEKAFLYKNCYAYVCPSLFEGFALTPLEALSFNKPIILSDIEVLHEVYGEKFIYFNPYDYKSLNTAIKKIDDEYKNYCTDNELLNKYSWKNFLLRNLKVYEEIEKGI